MDENTESYVGYAVGSSELVELLIAEHMGWAASIARSVARAWNMDWELDGLDGGAYEGLVFCARRYDPATNVPFRAYARRRVHQSATEEARKSKLWQKYVGNESDAEQQAREISACLFELFPELRDGVLPAPDGEFGDFAEATRNSVRQLLVSASLFLTSTSKRIENPEKALEYRNLVRLLSSLEHVHQQILWAVYWQGLSQRSLADEWGLDELAVIREHKEILGALQTAMAAGRTSIKKIKVRPGLRNIDNDLKEKKSDPPFSSFIKGAATFVSILILLALWQCLEWAFPNMSLREKGDAVISEPTIEIPSDNEGDMMAITRPVKPICTF